MFDNMSVDVVSFCFFVEGTGPIKKEVSFILKPKTKIRKILKHNMKLIFTHFTKMLGWRNL